MSLERSFLLEKRNKNLKVEPGRKSQSPGWNFFNCFCNRFSSFIQTTKMSPSRIYFYVRLKMCLRCPTQPKTNGWKKMGWAISTMSASLSLHPALTCAQYLRGNFLDLVKSKRTMSVQRDRGPPTDWQSKTIPSHPVKKFGWDFLYTDPNRLWFFSNFDCFEPNCFFVENVREAHSSGTYWRESSMWGSLIGRRRSCVHMQQLRPY
jgi:hypothetical protein